MALRNVEALFVCENLNQFSLLASKSAIIELSHKEKSPCNEGLDLPNKRRIQIATL